MISNPSPTTPAEPEKVWHSKEWLLAIGQADTGIVAVYPIESDGAIGATATAEVQATTGAYFPAFHPSRNFVYIPLESGDNRILGYAVDPKGGALTEIPGSPFTVPATNVSEAVMHPSGRYLYALAYGNTGAEAVIAVYSVDQTSGTLAPLAAGTVHPGIQAWRMQMDPLGRFLFTGTYSGGLIEVYQIGSDGSLHRENGSPYTASGPVHGMRIHPSGSFLAVRSWAGHPNVNVWPVDPEIGALGTRVDSALGIGLQIDFDTTGSFLAMTRFLGGTGEVSFADFDQDTGALSALPGSPVMVAPGVNLEFIGAGITGSRVYVGSPTENKIYQYSVNASGATPIGTGFVTTPRTYKLVRSFLTLYSE